MNPDTQGTTNKTNLITLCSCHLVKAGKLSSDILYLCIMTFSLIQYRTQFICCPSVASLYNA